MTPVGASLPTRPLPGGRERLEYLREMCGLLWPPPATVTVTAPRSRGSGGRLPAGASSFLLIAGMTRPRLLVPASPRAAAAAVRGYGEAASRAARIRKRMLSAGVSAGLGAGVARALLPGVRVTAPAGAATIETYLAGVLGREVRVSMHLGPPRANRKPVLQLVTPAGEPAGFAKIGISPLTRELVRAEGETLTLLGKAGLRHLIPPEVAHRGQWQGLEVLVLHTLPVWQPRRAMSDESLATAMAEVARVAGTRKEPVAASGYLHALRDRVGKLGDTGERGALLTALGSLAARAGDTALEFGAWHGDWTPWNMASTREGLLVWDWERFASGAPVGFDALHHWLQTEVVPRHRPPEAAATACITQAPRLLAPFGTAASQARITALLYLADLATRYLADGQAGAGARLGSAGRWLIPAITGALQAPSRT